MILSEIKRKKVLERVWVCKRGREREFGGGYSWNKMQSWKCDPTS